MRNIQADVHRKNKELLEKLRVLEELVEFAKSKQPEAIAIMTKHKLKIEGNDNMSKLALTFYTLLVEIHHKIEQTQAVLAGREK